LSDSFFGNGEIKQLKNIISKKNIQKPLILRGNNSFQSFSNSVSELIPMDYESFILNESFINLKLLTKGINYCNKFKFDCIICVGGGSVIDFGKLISIFSSNLGNYSDYLYGSKSFKPKKNSLIAIPTTSGSGSEATHFAVLYDGFKKLSISHDSLLPDYAIIDPELTYSLPPLQTAISGMDALCQGIESLWSKGSTNKSRVLSKKAIKLAVNNISKSVLNPTNSNREAMAKSSNLAGKAINISKTTAAHAFSYPLTRFMGISHGHAVSLTIGEFLIHNSDNIVNDKKSLKIFGDLFKIFGVSNALEAKSYLSNLMEQIGLFTKLPETISYEKTVSEVISNVNLDRLANNPSKVSDSDLRRIYKSLF
tara:strand:- start:103 stop:1203 length:1101 start_codon:yes stop_codon:yes gene_type:complete